MDRDDPVERDEVLEAMAVVAADSDAHESNGHGDLKEIEKRASLINRIRGYKQN